MRRQFADWWCVLIFTRKSMKGEDQHEQCIDSAGENKTDSDVIKGE